MARRSNSASMRMAFIAVIVTAFLFLFLFFSIGVKTRRYTYADSKSLAREISHKEANETGKYISSALNVAHEMADKALIYKKLGGNRNDIVQMLQDEVVQNANFMGAWTMWEPNAFDGRDAFYKNDTLYDRQGTMSIAFFKYGDSVLYERNDSTDFQEQFYTVPHNTKKDLILEPFHYQYHGHSVVFYQTSAVVPIMEGSDFLGVFGIDINLDSLQARFSQIRLYETGYLTLISGSGIIISHKDSSLIDKNFYSIVNQGERDKYKALSTNQELTLETVSEFSHERVFRFFYPVLVGSGAKPWYIMVEIPINQAAGRSQQLLITAYATLVLGLLLLMYLIVNIFDRRRYENDILNSMKHVEESNRIVSESEIRFRTIFENANDAILIMKEMDIIDCNLISCSMFGCGKQDIIDKTPVDFSPEFQPNGIESSVFGNQMIKAALQGNPQRFEWQHKRPDGSLFYAEVSLNRLMLTGSELIQAIVRDITERKKSEGETLEKKERLQQFVDSLTDWIYSARINDDQANEAIRSEAPEGFFALTGYHMDEIDLDIRAARKIIFEADQDRYLNYMLQLTNGNKIPPFEYRIKHKSGALRWVRSHTIIRYNASGNYIGYDVLVTDITERKNAEAALQESEKNFRNIFDKTNHGIIIVAQDGRILAANQAFTNISGYSLDPDKPLNVSEVVVPEQLQKMRERIIERYSREDMAPFEYKARYKDGRIHVIEADGSMMDFNGQLAILVVLRDVTEIRESEKRVMEAVIQTEEAERSRIAQDLHDGLGPVLSTIKLYFQVYNDTSDAAKKVFLIDKLKSTIDEAIKTVSEISRNLSPHVLRNYGFYAAIKQFIHQIEQTNLIRFTYEFDQEHTMHSNTAIFLYRAVSELISNSIKHAGCSAMHLKITKVTDVLCIEYSDDGIGFDVEKVLSKPATGSGLQNILNRINALNGNVTMERKEGKGMITILHIPV